MFANLTAVSAALFGCADQCNLNYQCLNYSLDNGCHHHIPGKGINIELDWVARTPIGSGCNASMAFCLLDKSGMVVPLDFVPARPLTVQVSPGIGLTPGAITRSFGELNVIGGGEVMMLGCGPIVVSKGLRTTVSNLQLSPDGRQCTPLVSAVRGAVTLEAVDSAVVTGSPKSTPPSATVTAVNVSELGIGHVGGKVTPTGGCVCTDVTIASVGKLVLQLARTAPLSVTGVAAVSINVSRLTGAFTPEFESVFSGNKPSLPPDPELIAALNTAFGVVAAVSWSGVFVEGLDRLTVSKP